MRCCGCRAWTTQASPPVCGGGQLAVDGKRGRLRRDLFIDKVWDWKDDSGGTIGGQMRRLGDGVDWSRDRFTMDDGLSRAVRTIFRRLYTPADLSGRRLVTWSPVLNRRLGPRGLVRRRRGRVGVVPVRVTRRCRPHVVVATTRVGRCSATPRSGASPMTTVPTPGGLTLPRPFVVDRELIIVADEHVDPESARRGQGHAGPRPERLRDRAPAELPMPSIIDTKGRIVDTGTVRRHGPLRRPGRVARGTGRRGPHRRGEETVCTASAFPAQRRIHRTRGVAAVVGEGQSLAKRPVPRSVTATP